ncbi:MAG: tetratricopeptide repeat protein, partial [Elusimicrobia bacterium]|nr:tetratricopeptide repeat protein [Elusimicrobiota bacterium]
MKARTLRTLAAALAAGLALEAAASAARLSRTRRERHYEPPAEEDEEARPEPKKEKSKRRLKGREAAAESYDAALTAYRLGDFATAGAVLNEALDADDGFMPAWALRAQVRGAAGDTEGMLRDIVKPLRGSRSEAAFRRARADAKTLAGRPAEAVKDYDAALDKDSDDPEAYLGRGRARRSLGDLDGAIDDFQRAVKERPDHLTARIHLARAYADADKVPQAVRELTRVLNGNRDFAMAYEVLASVLASQGDERAFPAWSRAIQLSPENSRPRVGRALMYLKKGNKTLAEKDFVEAIRLAPKDFAPLYNRGESWCRLGNKEGCVADFKAALALDVPDAEAAAAMGDRLAENELLDDALAMYTKGLAAALADPRTGAKGLAAMVLTRRAAVYIRMNESRKALADHNAAVSAAPDDPAVWLARAELEAKLGDARRAVADFDKAIALKPDHARALLGRGTLLSEAGKAEDAAADFTAALKADTQLGAAYARRGRLAAARGAWDEALQDFTKAVEVDPGDPESLLDLGTARLRRREFWKAIAALDRSLKQGGPAAPARAARAEARAALGMTSQALVDLDEALKADPKSSELYTLAGFVELKLRAYPEAIRALDRAVALDRKNSRAFRLRGLAHAGLGELAEASNDMHKAVDLAPRPVGELVDLCHVERLRGRTARAVDACSKALQLDPDRGWAYIQRGLAHLAGGDASRAARDLDDGSRLEPPRPQALLARSIAHAALRQYKESDRAYRE